jgi:NADPH2:quinone reductase
MKSVLVEAPGGSESLRLAEIPEPQIVHPREIRVRLFAAALNPVDYKVRRSGGYGENRVLGCDGAGVVDAVGSEVRRFTAGDEVYFVNGGYGTEQGTYAQYVVIDERYVAQKPRSIDFGGAAAVPLVLVTAWEALYGRANIRAGQRLLVQGGAGGVGHVAVQLGVLAGAHVSATVSSAAKAELVASFGATAIDYRTQPASGKFDVVFDTVGGETFDASIELLDYYGTLVTCVERRWPAMDPSTAMQRNVRVAYTWMPAPQVYGLHPARIAQTDILERGARLIDEGKLRVIVGATYPLERIAEAHDALENGRVTGKVVVTIS